MPKVRRAAALKYRPGQEDAPEVTAAGSGMIAERILDAAREAGIPVREDPLLADALAQLDAGEQIPADLYLAVAELLVWAWEADEREHAKASAALAGAA